MANEQRTEIVLKNLGEIHDLLAQAQDRIAAVLPHHIKVDRMISMTMELVSGDSKLSLCEPLSILTGVLEASQLGLLLNKHLGHGYLVPFKSGTLSEKYGRDIYQAQFLIGYRGFVHLVMSDSPATSVYGRMVYAGEEFRIAEGTEHRLIHIPSLEGRDLKDYIGAYAAVIYKDSTQPDFEWMPKKEIEKVRAFSKAKGPDSPWQTWTEEMIKKTPLRRLCKRLKLSPEIIAATVRDEYRELGYEGEQPRREIIPPRRLSERLAASPSIDTPTVARETQSGVAIEKPESQEAPKQLGTKESMRGSIHGIAESVEDAQSTKGKAYVRVKIRGCGIPFTLWDKDQFENMRQMQGRDIAMDYEERMSGGKTYRNIIDFWIFSGLDAPEGEPES